MSVAPSHPTTERPDPPEPAAAWPYPRWFAHRGAGALAPENTLAAFRLGASLGWRAYECDVKLSADGQPFLLHDATLGRTLRWPQLPEPQEEEESDEGFDLLTPDTLAGELTWAELSRLDAGSWAGRRFAGEPLPTLEAIAAWCLAQRHALNIEIKPTPGDEARTGRRVAEVVRRLWKEAVASGHSPWPLLSSFRPDALAAAFETAPELPRALLLDSLWEDCFDVAERLDCVAVVLNHQLLDGPALVQQAHSDGLKLLVYTVNDAQRAEQLLDWGVNGLITDAVDRFLPD